jgi:hypothetical protein
VLACHVFRYLALTFVTGTVTCRKSRSAKDGSGRHSPGLERERCPRAELRSAPGQLWASTRRYYGRCVRCFTGLGQTGAGNARLAKGVASAVASQEAWPGVEPEGLAARRQEPRWNADRRAAPEASAGGNIRRRGAEITLQNAFVGVPLPFFLSSFVIAGLDPAIHVAGKLVQIIRWVSVAATQHGPPGQARWRRKMK